MRACGSIVAAFLLATIAADAAAAGVTAAAPRSAPAPQKALAGQTETGVKILGNPRPAPPPVDQQQREPPGFYVGVVTPESRQFGKRIHGGLSSDQMQQAQPSSSMPGLR